MIQLSRECQNICVEIRRARFVNRVASYLYEKYCLTCRYAITKEFNFTTCPCCGYKYRLKSNNKNSKTKLNKKIAFIDMI